jgi:hypothetical protein
MRARCAMRLSCWGMSGRGGGWRRGRRLGEEGDLDKKLTIVSCAGVVLVVFGVLVLVHGASLGGSGAGLWAGAGALVAGALGVVATLATTSSSRASSGFSSAHLASSLVALALSNMAAITALTAVVRDAQRAAPDAAILALPVSKPPARRLVTLTYLDPSLLETSSGLNLRVSNTILHKRMHHRASRSRDSSFNCSYIHTFISFLNIN